MRRFDEEKSLDRLAASRTLGPSLAVAVADAILRSHDNAPRADGASWLASIPTLIDRNTAKFRTMRGLDAAAIDQLDAASRECLTRHQHLLSQRAAQGFVRRCHGDPIASVVPMRAPVRLLVQASRESSLQGMGLQVKSGKTEGVLGHPVLDRLAPQGSDTLKVFGRIPCRVFGDDPAAASCRCARARSLLIEANCFDHGT